MDASTSSSLAWVCAGAALVAGMAALTRLDPHRSPTLARAAAEPTPAKALAAAAASLRGHGGSRTNLAAAAAAAAAAGTGGRDGSMAGREDSAACGPANVPCRGEAGPCVYARHVGPLPSPGDIVRYDFRPGARPSRRNRFLGLRFSRRPRAALTPASAAAGAPAAAQCMPPRAPGSAMRIVQARRFRASFSPHSFLPSESLTPRRPQWNIERGYQLGAVIAELRRLDADVIGLQEIDVGCDRTGGADVGREIAAALGLCYAFVCEFAELHSPLRSPETQGGGVHGNAILSRWDLSDVRAIEHAHQPIDWAVDGAGMREPRTGRRLSLAAVVATPHCGPLLVVSVHLEVFCGPLGRIRQFGDVMAFCRAESESTAGCAMQVICGDLNTMAHGLARLSPRYCRDALRWRSVGLSEPQLWARDVLAWRTTDRDASLGGVTVTHNKRLETRWGLEVESCRDVLNPGFDDPFDVDRDVTVINHAGLFRGKLDWLLLRGMAAAGCSLGNLEFESSDHRVLIADVSPESRAQSQAESAVVVPTAWGGVRRVVVGGRRWAGPGGVLRRWMGLGSDEA